MSGNVQTTYPGHHKPAEDAVVRNFRITTTAGKCYAKDIALRKLPMTIQTWDIRLNRFIAAADREILQNAGKVTAEIAQAHTESEFEKYRIVQDWLFESDFDRFVALEAKAKVIKPEGGGE